MTELDVGDLRAVFDEQLRGMVPNRRPEGVHVELEGPLTCFFGTEGRGFVDYRDLGGLEAAVWDDDRSRLAEMLEGELVADPHALAIVVAEADAAVVCAAWVRYAERTDFASLWGGATLPAWRGRGIYRATVAYRARLAAD